MDVLLEFYGIGPESAKSLWNDLVSRHFVDPGKTYTKAQISKILSRKSIYEHLPESAKMDIKYKPLRTIPRAVIERIERELTKLCSAKFDIAGSYRRGKQTSSDIDIVLLKPSLSASADVWADFTQCANKSRAIRISQPFAQGNDKVSVLIRASVGTSGTRSQYVYVKSDVFLSEPDEYIFALLYATGSGQFNVRMRAVAKKKGYLLNQRGLYKKDGTKLVRIPADSEREIFEALGMTYREPAARIT